MQFLKKVNEIVNKYDNIVNKYELPAVLSILILGVIGALLQFIWYVCSQGTSQIFVSSNFPETCTCFLREPTMGHELL